jgi:hypothetical protein
MIGAVNANRGTLVSAVALGGLALLAAGCAESGGPGPAVTRPVTLTSPLRSTTVTPAATPAAVPATTSWPVVIAVPAARAGQHQTGQRPPAHSRVFQAEMTDLWAAVASGRPALGLPAFFPLVAYEQVKAIADPAADWRHRLVAEFDLDVRAAHQLLGRQARHARLVRVVIPESEADWIDPGVCDNGIGYWHVANARVVYRAGGQERSFGIATLISWRGRWYVVHLGGEVRSGYGGMVDQPAAGPGTPGPPGGC